MGSRADWGGLGIVIGEGTDDAKSPVGIWYCVDDPKLVLASGGNEFAAFFGTEQEDGSVDPGVAFAVGDTFTLSRSWTGRKFPYTLTEIRSAPPIRSAKTADLFLRSGRS